MYKKYLVIGIIILFFGASAVPVLSHSDEKADVLERRPVFDIETFYPTDDAYIDMESGGGVGWDIKMYVRNRYGGGGSDGWEKDTLIKFDISSISPGTTIDYATLYLYYFEYLDTNPVGRPLNLYRILENWDEETVTWNTRPDYASEITTFSAVPNNPGVWMTWDVTSDVQDFVDEVKENYGWWIMDETYWGQVGIPTPKFRTKEYGDFIPYLEVETENGGNGLKTNFIIGKLDNLTTGEETITFDAINIRRMQFSPFAFIPYTSGEQLTINKDYTGLLTVRFILAICKMTAI